jgi:heme/copper-type cytochrome/quinol oxidase subunit 3
MSDVALHRSDEIRAPALPVGSIGNQASGYFGVWWVIITEASLFIYLIFGYAYCAMQFPGKWPPSGPPELTLALPDTLILILSSVAVALGEHAIKQGKRARLTLGLVVGFVLGIVFVAIQLKEWASRGTTLASNLYYSFYFTTTGFHMAHVVVGILILGALTILVSARQVRFGAQLPCFDRRALLAFRRRGVDRAVHDLLHRAAVEVSHG